MPRLDEIDLALPLQGTEGVSIDYLSAIRTQYLFSQHQSLMAQIRFADAKAAALMTLMGLIAFRGPFDIPVGTEGPLPLLPALYFLVITVSIAFCILSVFPRYPRAATRDRLAESDLWSWPSLVAPGRPPTDYATYMQTSEVSELVHSVALSNGAVAAILLRKFMLLRIAFIAALGVLLLVALRISGIEAMI